VEQCRWRSHGPSRPVGMVGQEGGGTRGTFHSGARLKSRSRTIYGLEETIE